MSSFCNQFARARDSDSGSRQPSDTDVSRDSSCSTHSQATHSVTTSASSSYFTSSVSSVDSTQLYTIDGIRTSSFLMQKKAANTQIHANPDGNEASTLKRGRRRHHRPRRCVLNTTSCLEHALAVDGMGSLVVKTSGSKTPLLAKLRSNRQQEPTGYASSAEEHTQYLRSRQRSASTVCSVSKQLSDEANAFANPFVSPDPVLESSTGYSSAISVPSGAIADEMMVGISDLDFGTFLGGAPKNSVKKESCDDELPQQALIPDPKAELSSGNVSETDVRQSEVTQGGVFGFGCDEPTEDPATDTFTFGSLFEVLPEEVTAPYSYGGRRCIPNPFKGRKGLGRLPPKRERCEEMRHEQARTRLDSDEQTQRNAIVSEEKKLSATITEAAMTAGIILKVEQHVSPAQVGRPEIESSSFVLAQRRRLSIKECRCSFSPATSAPATPAMAKKKENPLLRFYFNDVAEEADEALDLRARRQSFISTSVVHYSPSPPKSSRRKRVADFIYSNKAYEDALLPENPQWMGHHNPNCFIPQITTLGNCFPNSFTSGGLGASGMAESASSSCTIRGVSGPPLSAVRAKKKEAYAAKAKAATVSTAELNAFGTIDLVATGSILSSTAVALPKAVVVVDSIGGCESVSSSPTFPATVDTTEQSSENVSFVEVTPAVSEQNGLNNTSFLGCSNSMAGGSSWCSSPVSRPFPPRFLPVSSIAAWPAVNEFSQSRNSDFMSLSAVGSGSKIPLQDYHAFAGSATWGSLLAAPEPTASGSTSTPRHFEKSSNDHLGYLGDSVKPSEGLLAVHNHDSPTRAGGSQLTHKSTDECVNLVSLISSSDVFKDTHIFALPSHHQPHSSSICVFSTLETKENKEETDGDVTTLHSPNVCLSPSFGYLAIGRRSRAGYSGVNASTLGPLGLASDFKSPVPSVTPNSCSASVVRTTSQTPPPSAVAPLLMFEGSSRERLLTAQVPGSGRITPNLHTHMPSPAGVAVSRIDEDRGTGAKLCIRSELRPSAKVTFCTKVVVVTSAAVADILTANPPPPACTRPLRQGFISPQPAPSTDDGPRENNNSNSVNSIRNPGNVNVIIRGESHDIVATQQNPPNLAKLEEKSSSPFRPDQDSVPGPLAPVRGCRSPNYLAAGSRIASSDFANGRRMLSGDEGDLLRADGKPGTPLLLLNAAPQLSLSPQIAPLLRGHIVAPIHERSSCATSPAVELGQPASFLDLTGDAGGSGGMPPLRTPQQPTIPFRPSIRGGRGSQPVGGFGTYRSGFPNASADATALGGSDEHNPAVAFTYAGSGDVNSKLQFAAVTATLATKTNRNNNFYVFTYSHCLQVGPTLRPFLVKKLLEQYASEEDADMIDEQKLWEAKCKDREGNQNSSAGTREAVTDSKNVSSAMLTLLPSTPVFAQERNEHRPIPAAYAPPREGSDVFGESHRIAEGIDRRGRKHTRISSSVTAVPCGDPTSPIAAAYSSSSVMASVGGRSAGACVTPHTLCTDNLTTPSEALKLPLSQSHSHSTFKRNGCIMALGNASLLSRTGLSHEISSCALTGFLHSSETEGLAASSPMTPLRRQAIVTDTSVPSPDRTLLGTPSGSAAPSPGAPLRFVASSSMLGNLSANLGSTLGTGLRMQSSVCSGGFSGRPPLQHVPLPKDIHPKKATFLAAWTLGREEEAKEDLRLSSMRVERKRATIGDNDPLCIFPDATVSTESSDSRGQLLAALIPEQCMPVVGGSQPRLVAQSIPTGRQGRSSSVSFQAPFSDKAARGQKNRCSISASTSETHAGGLALPAEASPSYCLPPVLEGDDDGCEHIEGFQRITSAFSSAAFGKWESSVASGFAGSNETEGTNLSTTNKTGEHASSKSHPLSPGNKSGSPERFTGDSSFRSSLNDASTPPNGKMVEIFSDEKQRTNTHTDLATFEESCPVRLARIAKRRVKLVEKRIKEKAIELAARSEGLTASTIGKSRACGAGGTSPSCSSRSQHLFRNGSGQACGGSVVARANDRELLGELCGLAEQTGSFTWSRQNTGVTLSPVTMVTSQRQLSLFGVLPCQASVSPHRDLSSPASVNPSFAAHLSYEEKICGSTSVNRDATKAGIVGSGGVFPIVHVPKVVGMAKKSSYANVSASRSAAGRLFSIATPSSAGSCMASSSTPTSHLQPDALSLGPDNFIHNNGGTVNGGAEGLLSSSVRSGHYEVSQGLPVIPPHLRASLSAPHARKQRQESVVIHDVAAPPLHGSNKSPIRCLDTDGTSFGYGVSVSPDENQAYHYATFCVTESSTCTTPTPALHSRSPCVAYRPDNSAGCTSLSPAALATPQTTSGLGLEFLGASHNAHPSRRCHSSPRPHRFVDKSPFVVDALVAVPLQGVFVSDTHFGQSAKPRESANSQFDEDLRRSVCAYEHSFAYADFPQNSQHASLVKTEAKTSIRRGNRPESKKQDLVNTPILSYLCPNSESIQSCEARSSEIAADALRDVVRQDIANVMSCLGEGTHTSVLAVAAERHTVPKIPLQYVATVRRGFYMNTALAMRAAEAVGLVRRIGVTRFDPATGSVVTVTCSEGEHRATQATGAAHTEDRVEQIIGAAVVPNPEPVSSISNCVTNVVSARDEPESEPVSLLSTPRRMGIASVSSTAAPTIVDDMLSPVGNLMSHLMPCCEGIGMEQGRGASSSTVRDHSMMALADTTLCHEGEGPNHYHLTNMAQVESSSTASSHQPAISLTCGSAAIHSTNRVNSQYCSGGTSTTVPHQHQCADGVTRRSRSPACSHLSSGEQEETAPYGWSGGGLGVGICLGKGTSNVDSNGTGSDHNTVAHCMANRSAPTLAGPLGRLSVLVAEELGYNGSVGQFSDDPLQHAFGELDMALGDFPSGLLGFNDQIEGTKHAAGENAHLEPTGVSHVDSCCRTCSFSALSHNLQKGLSDSCTSACRNTRDSSRVTTKRESDRGHLADKCAGLGNSGVPLSVSGCGTHLPAKKLPSPRRSLRSLPTCAYVDLSLDADHRLSAFPLPNILILSKQQNAYHDRGCGSEVTESGGLKLFDIIQSPVVQECEHNSVERVPASLVTSTQEACGDLHAVHSAGPAVLGIFESHPFSCSHEKKRTSHSVKSPPTAADCRVAIKKPHSQATLFGTNQITLPYAPFSPNRGGELNFFPVCQQSNMNGVVLPAESPATGGSHYASSRPRMVTCPNFTSSSLYRERVLFEATSGLGAGVSSPRGASTSHLECASVSDASILFQR